MSRPKATPSTRFAALLTTHRDGRATGAVCLAAGMTTKALNDIEAGRAMPGLSVFAALVRRYGLTDAQLRELVDAVPVRAVRS